VFICGATDGNAMVKVNLLLCMCAAIVEIQLSLLDAGEWSGLAPWLLYTWGKNPRYPLNEKLGGPWSQS